MSQYGKSDSYVDGSTTIDYVLSFLDEPAPAYAGWITRRRLAAGKSVKRGKWLARRWTMEEFATLLRSGQVPLPLSDDLAALVQEYEQERRDMAATEP